MARSVKLFYERVFMESFVESAGVLLDNKQRINTAIDPELEDLMREAGRAAANILHTRYPSAVPQADGYSDSGTLPEDVTWVGEIDGKRYTGLGPKSGTLDHLPEGSH